MNGKIYYLCDETNKPRYIGFTEFDLIKRLREHKNDYRHNQHKVNWIKKNRNSLKIVLIEDGIKTIDDMKEKEIYYINLYKNNGFNLLNATDGGDKCPFNRKGMPPINKDIRKIDNDLIYQIQNDYIPNKFGIIKLSKKYNIPTSSIERYLKIILS